MFIIIRCSLEDMFEHVMDVVETHEDLISYVEKLYSLDPTLTKIQDIPYSETHGYTIPFAKTDTHDLSFQYFNFVKEPSWSYKIKTL